MYKCNESFTSVTGRYYSVGEEISVAHYGTLPDGEAKYFTYVGSSSENNSVDDGNADLALGSMVSSTTVDTETFETQCPEPAPQADFGGGDSGGAGATGDF